MARQIQTHFPNTSGGVQEYNNNDGDTILNLGQEPELFTPDAGDYTSNTNNNLVINNDDLANSVSVGDTIQIDIDGVLTDVVVGEVDSAAGTVTILGDQSTLNTDIAGGTNVSVSTLFEQAVFEGVAEGLSIVNPNGTTNPLHLVQLVTMTTDQYEDMGFTPDDNTLYFLSEDPITT